MTSWITSRLPKQSGWVQRAALHSGWNVYLPLLSILAFNPIRKLWMCLLSKNRYRVRATMATRTTIARSDPPIINGMMASSSAIATPAANRMYSQLWTAPHQKVNGRAGERIGASLGFHDHSAGDVCFGANFVTCI